jgi:hypothetical protein
MPIATFWSLRGTDDESFKEMEAMNSVLAIADEVNK